MYEGLNIVLKECFEHSVFRDYAHWIYEQLTFRSMIRFLKNGGLYRLPDGSYRCAGNAFQRLPDLNPTEERNRGLTKDVLFGQQGNFALLLKDGRKVELKHAGYFEDTILPILTGTGALVSDDLTDAVAIPVFSSTNPPGFVVDILSSSLPRKAVRFFLNSLVAKFPVQQLLDVLQLNG